MFRIRVQLSANLKLSKRDLIDMIGNRFSVAAIENIYSDEPILILDERQFPSNAFPLIEYRPLSDDLKQGILDRYEELEIQDATKIIKSITFAGDNSDELPPEALEATYHPGHPSN